MATADNLPGPGRGIDKIYQRLGRGIERQIENIAYRLGYNRFNQTPEEGYVLKFDCQTSNVIVDSTRVDVMTNSHVYLLEQTP